ncbi:probable cyclic nucleotide-gated ion channel 5 isoform X1 [Cryptomeria japonica]|uniref:probable cyclic nucleotide-gated ion channel 5 isoform X1 n=1 Tax=Cryptomeria japonica TaxID=3369 RepID=UPI0025ABAE73|nr:probable cyclic nucleotide-gated ion channel 5 isoform X1 [Cryptomeria japonica]XP_057836860.1 probable cyclic nucleotide-gated ion channel 5 isoform X1 [Cryptomeria japonica]XP_059063846.1 probable cyclic nucleotide-gated ion channel 5 isoform X1 [Cryptomeria japonica]XP_059063847.1 probable cyclic nucleotide-gated ion channel 5 isoform X1 [Cryptomeria japonica]XP_059063848.1 probable cyclic nucleotide-gated ion channel 5 isoform X1 [Cryptomeria japonica]
MTIFETDSKSQQMGGQREKFVRFYSDLESEKSLHSERGRLSNYGSERGRFSNYGLRSEDLDRSSSSISSSVKRGLEKSSQGLKNIGRSLRMGVSRVVFPEDLKLSEKKIFDPQDKFLQRWNRFLVISCIIAVSVDPLFFYLPVVDDESRCMGIDKKLAIVVTVLRSLTDILYLVHMALQFRTAFIAPSSRVFGRGELVIDPIQIAKRYLSTYFIIDFLAVLPLPQAIIWIFIPKMRGSAALNTKNALRFVVFFQYFPRFFRIYPLSSEVIRTAGVFTETAWAGAAYNLLLYILASHVLGACWYLLAVEREDGCWRKACRHNNSCKLEYLYCGNQGKPGFSSWLQVSKQVFDSECPVTGDDDAPFDFGIYTLALKMRIVASRNFVEKYFYCLMWGLQNLSTLGQGLQTSKFIGEVIFSIAVAIFGLILLALLIGNMQTYLQSLTIRLEEMRVKRSDTEQWMRHRLLPDDLRHRVRRYDQYKWLETRGVDEEHIIQSLPKDLSRDIKRHLCLGLVKRVPLFENMDDRLLDAMCERLKPSLYTEDTYIVREGDPVDEMLFIIRGHLESVTTNGGRTGFFNRGLLKQGDFCGEELLTWALDPKAGVNLPSSTRTVKALSEVEAFALRAEDLKFVASQFRRLHSRQVQHTFRFYSQQWRTWAACFIQAAWRRYCKRKEAEFLLKEEHKLHTAMVANNATVSPSFGATIYVSRFATNALRRVQKMRNMKLSERTTQLIKLQKPSEPDFSAEDPE